MTRMRAARIVVYVFAVPIVVVAAVFVARVFAADPTAAPSAEVRDYVGDIGARRYAAAYARLCEQQREGTDVSEFESIVAVPVIDHGGLDEVVVDDVELPEEERGREALVRYRVVWNDGTVWTDEARLELAGGEWRLCEFLN